MADIAQRHSASTLAAASGEGATSASAVQSHTQRSDSLSTVLVEMERRSSACRLQRDVHRQFRARPKSPLIHGTTPELWRTDDIQAVKARGTVALAEAWARWTDTLGQVSDNESQFSERVGQTEGGRTSVPRS